MAQPTTSRSEGDVSGALVEGARVFGQGGTDGLILYSMLVATILMFLALVITLWFQRGERKAFTDAAKLQGEASKELATAIASAHSADFAFKQAMGTMLVDLDRRFQEIQAARPPQP